MSGADDEARYGADIDTAYEEELKREMRLEGRPKPKPTGNVCRSCAPVPIFVPTPTGRVRQVGQKHAHDCPEHPGERIPTSAYVQGRSWPPGRWRR